MSTKKIISLLSAILCVLAFAACADDSIANDTPNASTKPLRFSVDGVGTRLHYNFESSFFTDGDSIGCVIASVDAEGNYTYLCNSAWTYRGKDNMLIFQYYWSENNGVYTKYTPTSDDTGSPYIMQDPARADASYLKSPYLETVAEGTNLVFCFYYPYVHAQALGTEYARVGALTEPSKDKFKELVYPNAFTTDPSEWVPNSYNANVFGQYMLTGEVRETTPTNNDYPCYGWRAFPAFVNHTQGSIAADADNNDTRLHNSDFLYTKATIDGTTTGVQDVRFAKKTATVIVYVEPTADGSNPMTNIYFTPTESQSLRRGNNIDLATGDQSTITYNQNGTYIQKNVYFNDDEQIIPCYRGQAKETNSSDEYYFYRLVLPAQSSCSMTLHFEGAFGDNGATSSHDLRLADNGLTSLQEGYLYTIRISKTGYSTIRINDWIDGGLDVIEPVSE